MPLIISTFETPLVRNACFSTSRKQAITSCSNPHAATLFISAHENHRICHVPSLCQSELFCCFAVLAEGVFQNSRIAFSPSVPFTFYFAWRPRRAPQFCFLQHLSCDNALFAYARCKCVTGAQVFHLRHEFGTHLTRVFKSEW